MVGAVALLALVDNALSPLIAEGFELPGTTRCEGASSFYWALFVTDISAFDLPFGIP